MRHLCCVRFLILLVLSFNLASAKKSAIVYYGDKISYPMVGIHDYIIVQPDNITPYNHGFKTYRERIYAYVSLGEVEKSKKYYKNIKKEWIIGENGAWKSKVVDVANSEFRDFLFKNEIEPLYKKGFRNFFLDTMDSYQLVSSSKKFQKKEQDGLVAFIKKIKQRFPESKIIINRGFEIIDRVHNDIEAMLFESLFNGIGGKNLSFKKVSQNDRDWLLEKIEKVKSYDLPIIDVEYLPRSRKVEAKNLVDEVERFGFIPYIAFSKELDSYGVSSKKPIKREVLLIYDDTQFDGKDSDDKVYSTAYLQLSLPVEYLGYVPILEPVSSFEASRKNLERFAGAIIWINGSYADKHPKKFTKLIKNIYFSRLKMLILESINENKHKSLFRTLGIRTVTGETSTTTARVKCKKGYTEFEVEPFVPNLGAFYKFSNAKTICELKTKKNRGTLWAVTNWGGFATTGVLITNINKYDLWIANPFKLIKEALRLQEFPIPDPTTENGKRFLFSHIDGDAIMSRVEWNPELFDGETIYEEILKKYDIPMSVSVIEGEIAKHGLYPKYSAKLKKIAKKMFALPNVEGATHTFTHPFFWGKISKDGKHLEPKYRLKVKNYKNFSIARETRGSLDYINRELMPQGKKANIVFWSGDCLPRENALEYLHKNGILNMNGGDTTIVDSTPWLSLIAPFGLKRGEYYQIHTGEQDENVYTKDWTGRFWGFRRAIQTYKLTNAPRRFKPIDIYYHFYSGSKRASLNALKELFDWAIKQDVMPIYTSSYILKALDFFYTSIAKGEKKGEFVVAGLKNLRTLRVKKSQFVDFEASKNVVGEREYLNSRYIHLFPKDGVAKVVIRDKRVDDNYLVSANAPLKDFKKSGDNLMLKFKGFVPLKVDYHLKNGCSLEEIPKAKKREKIGSIIRLEYEKKREATIRVQCN